MKPVELMRGRRALLRVAKMVQAAQRADEIDAAPHTAEAAAAAAAAVRAARDNRCGPLREIADDELRAAFLSSPSSAPDAPGALSTIAPRTGKPPAGAPRPPKGNHDE